MATLQNTTIPNGGTIGSTSAPSAIAIDSSGNVGIGTSSPSALIHLRKDNAELLIDGGSSAYDLTSKLGFTRGSIQTVIQSGSPSGDTRMVFSTQSSGTLAERMRIDSGGNLHVNRTSAGWVQGGGIRADGCVECVVSGDIAARIGRGTTTGTLIEFKYNNSAVGWISTGGTTVSYTSASDYRLKEDWQPMSGSIDRLKALNPVNFAWKADGSRIDGFLAHEAQEVVPEAVTGTKDAMRTEEYEVTPAVLDDDGNVVTEAIMGEREVPDYQGIDQAKLVPLLTAALQEAVSKIEALENRITQLESK